MNHDWKRKMGRVMQEAGMFGVVLFAAGTAAGQTAQQKGGMDTATTDVHGKFYCNIKALTPEERKRHKELGEKMNAARTAKVETAKGYEFQYDPGKISLGEVAEWVTQEGKCCSFFDFHIDLEEQGKLICLRLTGSEGVKEFLRSEFHL